MKKQILTALFLALAVTNSYTMIINPQEDIITQRQNLKLKISKLYKKIEEIDETLKNQKASLHHLEVQSWTSKIIDTKEFYPRMINSYKKTIEELKGQKKKILKEITELETTLEQVIVSESDFDFYDGEQVISCTIL